MQKKKPQLRVIAGGRQEAQEHRATRFCKMPLNDMGLAEERQLYRHVLAMNYVHRRADEGIELDAGQVIRSKKLLAEEASLEGITSEENCRKVLNDLTSRFSINRQSAARWLAMMVCDRQVFGPEAVVNAALMLIQNLCHEARVSLEQLGFAPKEIGELKLCQEKERAGILRGILQSKGYIKT